MNFAAEIDQAKLVQRNGSGAELFFDEVHGAFYFAGGDVIFGQALERTHGDEVEEAVETLAPAGFGADQAETFPVAQTVRLNPKNAAGFRPRVSFSQSGEPPRPRGNVR